MTQELGETTTEMMRTDDQAVQDILNRRPSGHYWIVIHHRKTRMKLKTGEMVLMRLIKDYDTKPKPLVGTVMLEVKDGEIINHIISPHDAPINWELVERKAGLVERPNAIRSPIAGAYLYN